MATALIYHNSYRKAQADGALAVGATLKVALTNTLPTAAQIVLDTVTNHPVPVAAGGYPSGGYTLAGRSSAIASTNGATVSFDRITVAAAGADIGPFRYCVRYWVEGSNVLLTTLDLGEEVTVGDGNEMTIDWNGTNPGIFDRLSAP